MRKLLIILSFIPLLLFSQGIEVTTTFDKKHNLPSTAQDTALTMALLQSQEWGNAVGAITYVLEDSTHYYYWKGDWLKLMDTTLIVSHYYLDSVLNAAIDITLADFTLYGTWTFDKPVYASSGLIVDSITGPPVARQLYTDPTGAWLLFWDGATVDTVNKPGVGGGGLAQVLSYIDATRVLSISDGNSVTLPLATTTIPGLMSTGAWDSLYYAYGDTVILDGAYDYITQSGQTITRNAINLDTDVESVLQVVNGGTAASSFFTTGVLYAAYDVTVDCTYLTTNSGFTYSDVSGLLTSTQYQSTTTTLAPFIVASDVMVTNLNANYLQGLDTNDIFGRVYDHELLDNIGVNTHPQIDTHIANGNIHFLKTGIDTVGTIDDGVWNGDIINIAYLDTLSNSWNWSRYDMDTLLANALDITTEDLSVYGIWTFNGPVYFPNLTASNGNDSLVTWDPVTNSFHYIDPAGFSGGGGSQTLTYNSLTHLLSISGGNSVVIGGFLEENQTITLSGDATGSGKTSIDVTVVDNSHNHDGTTISNLTTLDFQDQGVAQWINDAGYITSLGAETDPIYAADSADIAWRTLRDTIIGDWVFQDSLFMTGLNVGAATDSLMTINFATGEVRYIAVNRLQIPAEGADSTTYVTHYHLDSTLGAALDLAYLDIYLYGLWEFDTIIKAWSGLFVDSISYSPGARQLWTSDDGAWIFYWDGAEVDTLNLDPDGSVSGTIQDLAYSYPTHSVTISDGGTSAIIPIATPTYTGLMNETTYDSLVALYALINGLEIHDSVLLDTTTNLAGYIYQVGQTLTTRKIDLTTHVTDTLPTTSGGTGNGYYVDKGIVYAKNDPILGWKLINKSGFEYDELADQIKVGQLYSTETTAAPFVITSDATVQNLNSNYLQTLDTSDIFGRISDSISPFISHINNSYIHFLQSEIDTVGTIEEGIWNGDVINVAYLDTLSNSWNWSRYDMDTLLANAIDITTANITTSGDWVFNSESFTLGGIPYRGLSSVVDSILVIDPSTKRVYAIDPDLLGGSSFIYPEAGIVTSTGTGWGTPWDLDYNDLINTPMIPTTYWTGYGGGTAIGYQTDNDSVFFGSDEFQMIIADGVSSVSEFHQDTDSIYVYYEDFTATSYVSALSGGLRLHSFNGAGDHSELFFTPGSIQPSIIMKYPSGMSFTLDDEIVNKKYVDDAVAGGSGATNLSYSGRSATAMTIASSSGSDVSVPIAGSGLAGWMSGNAWDSLFTVYDWGDHSLEGYLTSQPWSTDANGITYSGGNVGIGVASSSTFKLRLSGGTYGWYWSSASSSYVSNDKFSWSDGLAAAHEFGSDGFLFNTQYGTIQSNSTTFKITDKRATTAGIEYNADYSAYYTDRSLVDKEYVTGLVGGVTETDPIYSAWDKDYNDLINTPTAFWDEYTDGISYTAPSGNDSVSIRNNEIVLGVKHTFAIPGWENHIKITDQYIALGDENPTYPGAHLMLDNFNFDFEVRQGDANLNGYQFSISEGSWDIHSTNGARILGSNNNIRIFPDATGAYFIQATEDSTSFRMVANYYGDLSANFTKYSLVDSSFVAQMITTGGGASDHGDLDGLGDDDHTQYAHLSQAETINADWDNTLNPWDVNEIEDDLSQFDNSSSGFITTDDLVWTESASGASYLTPGGVDSVYFNNDKFWMGVDNPYFPGTYNHIEITPLLIEIGANGVTPMLPVMTMAYDISDGPYWKVDYTSSGDGLYAYVGRDSWAFSSDDGAGIATEYGQIILYPEDGSVATSTGFYSDSTSFRNVANYYGDLHSQYTKYTLVDSLWVANRIAEIGGGGVTDHGALDGLGDDDHTQYAHLSQAETISADWDNALNPWGTDEIETDLSLFDNSASGFITSADVPNVNVGNGNIAYGNGTGITGSGYFTYLVGSNTLTMGDGEESTEAIINLYVDGSSGDQAQINAPALGLNANEYDLRIRATGGIDITSEHGFLKFPRFLDDPMILGTSNSYSSDLTLEVGSSSELIFDFNNTPNGLWKIEGLSTGKAVKQLYVDASGYVTIGDTVVGSGGGGGSGTVTSVSGGSTGLTFDEPSPDPTMQGTLVVANGGTGATTATGARTNLGLIIGTDVQAWDTDLNTWATVTPSNDGKSLVSAADYAAMRALLDLEAGTDFYSITAADNLLGLKLDTTLASYPSVTVNINDSIPIWDQSTDSWARVAVSAVSGAGGGDGYLDDVITTDLSSVTFDMITVADITGIDFRPETSDISDVSVTQTELAELETIGSTTISAAQWGYLGAMNAQPLESESNNLSNSVTWTTVPTDYYEENENHTGDVTGATALTIASGAIDESMLNETTGTGSPGDYLTLGASNNFTWITPSAGHAAVTLEGTPNYITAGGTDNQTLTLAKLDLPDDINDFTEVQLEAALSNATDVFTNNTGGDVTIESNTSTIGVGVVDEAMLNIDNAPQDGYYLTYKSTGSTLTWINSTTPVQDLTWDGTNGHIEISNGDDADIGMFTTSQYGFVPSFTGPQTGYILSTAGWVANDEGTVTSVSSATTNQLTIDESSPDPTLTIVTGAVADAGTALATGDQIYDFFEGIMNTSNLTERTIPLWDDGDGAFRDSPILKFWYPTVSDSVVQITDPLFVYSGAGGSNLYIGSDTEKITTTAGAGMKIYAGNTSTETITLLPGGDEDDNFEFRSTDLRPSRDGFIELGTTNNRWQHVWTDAITVTGGGSFASITLTPSAADVDADKWAVIDGSNNLEYRTGNQLLSDVHEDYDPDDSLTVNGAIKADYRILKNVNAMADHSTNGDAEWYVADQTVAAGDAVYMHTTGKMRLCDNDASDASNNIWGIVLIGGAANADILVGLPGGTIRDDTWAWATVGAKVFLSDAGTSGSTLTITEPSNGGDHVVHIGYVYDADHIKFLGKLSDIKLAE